MRTRLILLLDGNPFDCDFQLCWIKRGQEEGWIEFITDDWEPDCANYPDEAWSDVDLDCEVEDELAEAMKIMTALQQQMNMIRNVTDRN